MNQNMLDDPGKEFLLQLFKVSKADVATKVSMYEIGESLGMDRGQTDFIITELIGFDYVEIRTLSGGIGITTQGIDASRLLTGESGLQSRAPHLGSDPILNESAKEACGMMTAIVKSGATNSGLNFDALAELMADLKTIEAQLNSPKPKSGIIKESFRSILAVLEKAGNKEIAENIKNFLK